MDKPTRALIAGLILSAGIASVGTYRHNALGKNLESLEQQCRREDDERRKQAKDKSDAWWNARVVCESSQLLDQNAPGIQGQIARAHAELRAQPSLVPLAIVVAGVFAIPWTWYFMLRRIRELRDALVGKAPCANNP